MSKLCPVELNKWIDLDSDGYFLPRKVKEGEFGETVLEGEWESYCVSMPDSYVDVWCDEDGVWTDWLIYINSDTYTIVDEKNELRILKEQIQQGELDEWSSDLLAFLVWAQDTTAEPVADRILEEKFDSKERKVLEKYIREVTKRDW